jgi:hypothetical protein
LSKTVALDLIFEPEFETENWLLSITGWSIHRLEFVVNRGVCQPSLEP